MTSFRSGGFSVRAGFAVLGGYFVLHLVLRSVVSDSMQIDEAEEVLLAQNWWWGYGSQPPLYTWLQKILFEVFGVNVFALALLKNGLLFGTYLFTFLGAREILRNGPHAMLATFSLLLVPMLAWESQRDQTHLVLATMIAAATLYVCVRLLQTRQAAYYLLLGLLFGAGVLAKYNYVFYCVALLGALLTLAPFRSAVLNRKLLLTAGVILLVLAPHLYWVWTHPDLTFSQSYKFQIQKAAGFSGSLMGTVKLLTGVAAFGALLGLTYGLACLRAPVVSPNQANSALVGLVIRTMLIGLGLCMAGIWLFHVSTIKGRWLQPLLIAWPIVLVAWAQPKLTPLAARRILVLAGVVLVVVPAVMYGGVVAARWTGRQTNLNIPYDALAGQVRSAGFNRGVIVAEGIRLGGNLKRNFPDSTVAVPGILELPVLPDAPVLIAWHSGANDAIPNTFVDYVARTCGVALGALPAAKAVAPSRYDPNFQWTLSYALRPPTASPEAKK
ncbi:MAG: glycosyltransferase family 39 protein [Verrucomicrobia subdivision 3 bacterium]|nr:glycosyltransferase family 39 protein [Verrucomicrobiota bacterium]MCC6823573.1 glycosyltransferase family 39 protein [Limisphaerales bacterium]